MRPPHQAGSELPGEPSQQVPIDTSRVSDSSDSSTEEFKARPLSPPATSPSPEVSLSTGGIPSVSTSAHEKQTGDHLPATIDHFGRQSTLGGVVDAYERAFRETENPQIEDFLPKDSTDRIRVLQDILQVDIELRLRKKQQSVTVSEYLERFPELTYHPEIVIRLVEREVRCRQKLGYGLNLATYEADYPTLLPGIRQVFRKLGALPVEIQGYSQLEKIGQGGMGVVFRANETGLNRTVALKMIRDRAVGDSGSFQRFEMEARSLAALEHPNIVRIHSFGVREDGLPFFSLEYCHGGSLAELLAKDPPSPRQAARITSVLSKAMGFAHSRPKPIFHRDLKPGNVLLAKPCDSMEYLDVMTLKIADFGLAKTDDDGEGGFTQTGGGPMGTLYYMAPEQAANAKEAKGTADIYALGVILYEMIAGRVPFRGKDQRQILKQLEENDPVPLTRLVPGCPPDLETICLKCLEKKPENRYATAEALAGDLDAFLENRPITARPVGFLEKSGKWISRNKIVSSLAFAAILSLVLGLVFSILFAWRANEEAFAAKLAKAKAEGLQKQAEDLAQKATEANDNFKQAVEATERARTVGLLNQLLSASPEAIGQVLLSIDESPQTSEKILRDQLATANGRERERLELALLPRDDSVLDGVAKSIRTVSTKEVPFYIQRLAKWKGEFADDFWIEMANQSLSRAERLRLAACLAAWDPVDSRWEREGGTQWARLLVELDALELASWIPMVLPVRRQLYPELVRRLEAGTKLSASSTEIITGLTAAQLLGGIADDPVVLAQAASLSRQREFELLSAALGKNRDGVCDELEKMLASQQKGGLGISGLVLKSIPSDVLAKMKHPESRSVSRADAARVLARILSTLAFLGRPEHLWEALGKPHREDLLAELLAAVSSHKVSMETLVRHYQKENNPLVKSSIVKMIGFHESEPISMDSGIRESFISDLCKDYEFHPDPGLHASILWLLNNKWDEKKRLMTIENRLAKKQNVINEGAAWRLNSQGQTLVLIKPGLSFEMGGIPEDSEKLVQNGKDLEQQHEVMISHGFELSQKEVTLEEFQRFKPSFQPIGKVNPTLRRDVAVGGVSWFDAIGYCQWLTEKEGIPVGDYCFPASNEIRAGINIPANFIQKKGYRLPTEEEWEIAARAGNVMPYPCGMTADHIDHFAITWRNGRERLWPGGSRLPNTWGFFDMSGNVLEWTMDPFDIYDPIRAQEMKKMREQAAMLNVSGNVQMSIRGGSFNNSPTAARNSARLALAANMNNVSMGFRICRTVTPAKTK